MTINACQFKENAAGFGGAIIGEAVDTDIQIIRSEFSNNAAVSSGGAVFVRGVLHVVGCIFSNNRAKLGGAIAVARTHNTAVRAFFSECAFIGNFISGASNGLGGGGISSENGDVNVTECAFIGNRAGSGQGDSGGGGFREYGGGGIYADGGILVVLRSNFSNTASGHGDELTLEHMDDVFIRDTNIDNYHSGQSIYSIDSFNSCENHICEPADQYQCITHWNQHPEIASQQILHV